MIHLLPHNQKTLAEVWEFFEASNFSGGKAAITNCTGLGKSYVIMAAMERFQQMGKGKILLLAPTWEVIDQFLESGDFPDSDQIRYGIYQTLMKKRKMFANNASEQFRLSLFMTGRELPRLDDDGNLSIELNGIEDLGSFDLLVFDELHRIGAPEWGKAVKLAQELFPNACLLGASATPRRYDQKKQTFD